MGNSTTTIQSSVDLMQTMGALSVAQAAGGFTQLPWLAIANDVRNDLVSQKFNWKWNSFKIPSFCTTSYQCDYATVNQYGLGWLESCMWTDINNTSLPLPRWSVDVVRDLQPTSWAASPPTQVCWMYNSRLEQGKWPGTSKIYTQPLGATSTPQNPPTNITDPHGNILILTFYGTTAATGSGPDAGTSPTVGETITDGTCIWTVADPAGQGFRINPMPPATGVVYQLDIVAQALTVDWTSLDDTIDPIPDDYAGTFRAGMYAYCHKYSNDPNLKRQFPMVRQEWIADIMAALKQGDREPDGAGFVPSRSAMAGSSAYSVGPANPYGSGWPGR